MLLYCFLRSFLKESQDSNINDLLLTVTLTIFFFNKVWVFTWKDSNLNSFLIIISFNNIGILCFSPDPLHDRIVPFYFFHFLTPSDVLGTVASRPPKRRKKPRRKRLKLPNPLRIFSQSNRKKPWKKWFPISKPFSNLMIMEIMPKKSKTEGLNYQIYQGHCHPKNKRWQYNKSQVVSYYLHQQALETIAINQAIVFWKTISLGMNRIGNLF